MSDLVLYWDANGNVDQPHKSELSLFLVFFMFTKVLNASV